MKAGLWKRLRINPKAEEQIIKMIMRLASVLVIGMMVLIVYTILRKGLPVLSWEMISEVPRGGFYFGGEGGILNAIVGSLMLAGGATLLAFLVGLPAALYLNVHLRKRKKWQDVIRLFIDVLWGIPSVVYGAFAFGIMIYIGLRASLLAGIITVALFIIPIMIRSMDEVLKQVSQNLFEAGLSLGATRSEISYRIFFRQCRSGVVTAVLLSFGRAIGDAAAVLFTAGFTDKIPTSLTQPVATLPLSIFFQLSSPIPAVQERAYAAATILTFIILIISISGRLFTGSFTPKSFES